MKYVSASEILPAELLREIQRYIQGQAIYIPSSEGGRKKWGQLSGYREYLAQRNSEIKRLFQTGRSLDQLADSYGLSEDSIKKIVYKKE